ncbi:MAG: threonine--tRNA ligase [Mollicutes bacterium PWAP]|nr:threonine--tRNA ligase [Mollicutes bacterium PWAP]
MKANKNLNKTASHVLGAAIKQLYPNAKFGLGDSIEEGFFYDFEFEDPLTDKDLKKIESKMKKIISGGYTILKSEPDEEWINDQKFKLELIKDLKEKKIEVTHYSMNNPSNGKSIFTDLSKGNYVEKTSDIKNFKLLSIAGAYWKGNSDNSMLTRIYGTSWETKEKLNDYLELLKERKERDHRKIGKEMNIFMFDLLSGQGFPIWLEDGMIIKNELTQYFLKLEKKYKWKEIQTPAFGEKKLYEISGHWSHYKDDMFQSVIAENEKLIMRPMTCPHHILVYKNKRRSYNDLPIRMSEQSRLYRHEKSGSLTGLERVRSMELTEGHSFARTDQIAQEFEDAYKMIKEALTKFDINIDYVSLSLRDKKDKKKYFDDDEMWDKAEDLLINLLNKMNIKYVEMKGEAAFYGPKLDIQVKTVLGHEITISTIQLDFLLPKNFGITYIGDDEKNHTPVMVHRSIIGTYERFIAVLLEQTKGNLPFWLAPKQIDILPVNLDFHLEYAKKIEKKLIEFDYRVNLESNGERLGKMIRKSQMSKTKIQLIIGDDEVSNEKINVREYGSKNQISMTIDEFINKYPKNMN